MSDSYYNQVGQAEAIQTRALELALESYRYVDHPDIEFILTAQAKFAHRIVADLKVADLL